MSLKIIFFLLHFELVSSNDTIVSVSSFEHNYLSFVEKVKMFP